MVTATCRFLLPLPASCSLPTPQVSPGAWEQVLEGRIFALLLLFSAEPSAMQLKPLWGPLWGFPCAGFCWGQWCGGTREVHQHCCTHPGSALGSITGSGCAGDSLPLLLSLTQQGEINRRHPDPTRKLHLVLLVLLFLLVPLDDWPAACF